MASRTACPAGRDVFEYMSEQGWSDGLPLVPPTPTRVAHMLTGTMRNPNEVLGHCAPMYGEVTIEKVAINSVMAGCAPQHLRLVLAAVEAMLTDEFNVHGVHATTMGATPAVIVHGPARHEAGLALEHGALGSSRQLRPLGGASQRASPGASCCTTATTSRSGCAARASAEDAVSAHWKSR